MPKQVYELSVDCAIKASRYEELAKCLSGLIDALYTMETVVCVESIFYGLMLTIYRKISHIGLIILFSISYLTAAMFKIP
jgi:hypothetical protein